MSGENCDHIWRCWDLRCHVGFKTTSKFQCGELGHLCMQEAFPSAWTHLGQGSFVPLRLQSWWTENADAIDWVVSLSLLPFLYWGIWHECKADLPALCQGSFSYSFILTGKGSLGSVPSPHHPSVFSNGQKEDWEVHVLQSGRVYWPSTDLKPCNILVRQEGTRRKLGLFITAQVLVLSTLELWCLRCWYHYNS